MRILLFILLLPITVFATDYKISGAGNDSNDGISAPFLTIAKANTITYSPGDKLEFAGGYTYTGNLLITNSGTDGSRIIIQSYGTGKAIINGGDGDCIKIRDAEYVTVNNLNLIGSGIDTFNLGYTTSRGCGVYAQSTATTGARLRGIVVTNCVISDIRTGILIGASTGTFPQTAWRGYDSVRITDNEIFKCGVAGISFWAEPNHSNGTIGNTWPHTFEAGETSAYPYITWGNAASRVVHKYIYVARNYVHNNWGFKSGSYFQSRSGAGIRINNVTSGTIEANLVKDCGNMWGDTLSYQQPANMEAEGTDSITWQYNESSHCRAGTAEYDAAGMDVTDADNHNTIIQYNYVHNNDGYGWNTLGVGVAGTVYNPIVRYNIFANNGVVRFANMYFTGPAFGVKIYNNISYDDQTAASHTYKGTTYSRYLKPLFWVEIASGQKQEGYVVNNIFYSKYNTNNLIYLADTSLKLMGNIYYSEATASPKYSDNTDLLTKLRNTFESEKIGGTNYGSYTNPNLSSVATPQQLMSNAVTALASFKPNTLTASELTQAIMSAWGVVPPTTDFYGNTFAIEDLKIGHSMVVDGNTTPAPPTVTGNDATNTLSASHALGDGEIVVSENNGTYQPYTGTINVGNVERAAGYWKFKIKSATGRNESAVVNSPVFTQFNEATETEVLIYGNWKN